MLTNKRVLASSKEANILFQVIATLWEWGHYLLYLQKQPITEVLLEISKLLDKYVGQSGLDSASGQPICNPYPNLYKIDFCLRVIHVVKEWSF